MDGGYSNGMNTLYQGGHQRHSYTELPNFQSQFQDPPQHGSHTLPPIQPQRSSTLGHVNSPYDQIPRRQQSAYSTNAVNFPVYTTHGSSQPIYTQSIPQYPNSTTFSQQSGHGMPLGHEYPPSANAHLANIRPMPIPGSAQMPGLPSSLNPSQGYGMQGGIATDHDLQPRTHVVGSQGRRGILPSDEGRPTAVAGQGVPPAKAPVIPVKDADGKFPCPHCNKNYLHAKHLKRHLLRRKVSFLESPVCN